jgi:hypothetical protein
MNTPTKTRKTEATARRAKVTRVGRRPRHTGYTNGHGPRSYEPGRFRALDGLKPVPPPRVARAGCVSNLKRVAETTPSGATGFSPLTARSAA